MRPFDVLGVGTLGDAACLVDGIQNGHRNIGNRQLTCLVDGTGYRNTLRTEFGNVDGYLRVFDVAFQKAGQGILQFVQSFAFSLNFACQRVSDITALIYPGAAADLVGLRVALLDGGIKVGVRPNHDIEDIATADAVAVSAFALLQALVGLGKYGWRTIFSIRLGVMG